MTIGALLLAGCSALGSAHASGKPQVVAAFYPYAFVAERVAGNLAEITDLTAPGIEPHDLELTPQQVADVSNADLVIYESGFQPSIDQAIQQNPPRQALDVTDVVPLQPLAKSPAGFSNSAKDPHLWLDPLNLVPIARRVATALENADPRHAASYQANADRLISDLKSLDASFRDGMAHCQRTEFVTSHAAFGYLAARYGLTMLAIAGLSPDVEPSAEHLAAVQRQITSDGLTTVFSERLGTSAYADSLAHDLGLHAAVLDPIEGLAKSDPNANYLTLMRGNLAALRKANGCR
jgi:zinc transport system substrate-binding protein